MTPSEAVYALHDHPVKVKDIIKYEGLNYKVVQINPLLDYCEIRCMNSSGKDRIGFTCEEFIKATKP